MFEMTVAGKELLASLLLDREFKMAHSLRNFTTYLPNTFIAISLSTGNAQLLDFILTHGECAINTFLIKGLSPVRFYFENHNSKFPKIECLSVLIKHGASLMIAAKDGLPIAYHILTTIQHPLYNALLDNAQTTLARKGFYRALIKSLENKIEKMAPDDPIRQEVLNNIKLFDVEFNLLQEKNSKLEQKLVTQSAKNSNQLSNNFEKSTLLTLQHDQAHQQALSDLKRAAEGYYQKLSKSQKLQILHNGNSILQTWNEYLKLIDPKSLLKEEVIKNIETITHQITLQSELFDLQKKIKQGNHFSHRQVQKLNYKQSALLKEIKKLDQESPLVVDSLSSRIKVLKTEQRLSYLKEVSDQISEELRETEEYLLQLFLSPSTRSLSNDSFTVETLEPLIQNNEEKSESLNQIQDRKMTFFGATTKKIDNASEDCQQNNVLATDQTP
jgi:hypothetical protein